jgi:16S rRNA (cytosine967-C5)-methyltransferase
MKRSNSVPGLYVRLLVLDALQRIQNQDGYSDVVAEQTLSTHRLSPVDAALFNELVRGVVRYRLTLDYYLAAFIKSISKLDPVVHIILQIGLYQLAMLERVPAHAVVHSSVALAAQKKRAHLKGLVNAVLRNYLRQPVALPDPRHEKNPVSALAICYSFPEWLVAHWVEQLGVAETEELLQASNTHPGLSLRISNDPDAFSRLTKEMNLNITSGAVPGYVTVKGMSYAQQQRLLHETKITVQDASAGLVALVARPRSGWKIADVCAAPGGKSLHLAELTAGENELYSADFQLSRLQKIAQNCKRLNIQSIHLLQADARSIPLLPVDLVMLDAPCSGLGVIRKKPDLKWNKTPQHIAQLAELQYHLLTSAATRVKKNGFLIYSTCTTTKQENENVVFAFLKKNSDFIAHDLKHEPIAKSFATRDGFIRTWPHRHDLDGSFVAKMQRVS